MRQQLVDTAGRLRGQPLQDVFQVCVGIVSIELGRVHQAHHRRGASASTQGSGEQPVRASQRDRADLVLYPVVVRRQAPVVDVARQRRPAAQAVVDRFGRCRAPQAPSCVGRLTTGETHRPPAGLGPVVFVFAGRHPIHGPRARGEGSACLAGIGAAPARRHLCTTLALIPCDSATLDTDAPDCTHSLRTCALSRRCDAGG
jgi:hypothetical protein